MTVAETETLAVEFANTRYAVRGRERDGLAEPAGLTAWLAGHEDRTGAGPDGIDPAAELARFTTLRDAVRALISATVDGTEIRSGDLDTVNAAAAEAPHWPVLAAGPGGGFAAAQRSAGTPAALARAAIARDVVGLLTGPQRENLRACHARGCIQYFVKDHPRREWCSPACGNRARAARHYARHRE